MKTLLITGANGKLGRVIVDDALSNGSKVVALVSSTDSLLSLRAVYEGTDFADNFFIYKIDLLCEKDLERVSMELSNDGIYPDYFVHSARSIKNLHVPDNGITKAQDMQDEYMLGCYSPYRIIMDMLNVNGCRLSSVVIISSIYGVIPFNPNLYDNPKKECPIQYSLNKAAQIHLAKELSVRLAVNNVRVNSVSFGGVSGRASQDFVDRYSKNVPISRMLEESEVIEPIRFLLSEKSSAITGHNLIVDGGMTVW